MSKPIKALNSLILIAVVLVVGMLGFTLIEGWPLLDALFMTVITLSTVGYGETRQLSDAGRIFDIILIFMSISVVAYGISNIVGFVVEGKLNSYFRVRRMEKLLSALKNHYIVCGAGRTGHAIMEEFLKAGVPFVMIDKNPEVIDRIAARDIPAIKGDSALDEILKAAGIDRAKRLIAVHATDSDNLFTVLSCRQLNPDIYIVARVLDKINEQKLLKCGADITISTSEIGGHRMASIALNPSINSFLDVVQKRSSNLSATVVEVGLESGSYLIGCSQRSADIRKRVGVTVLGILREGENIFNPGPDECFQDDDKLLIFGAVEQINEFKKVFLVPKAI